MPRFYKCISIILIVFCAVSILVSILIGIGHVFSAAFTEIFFGLLFYALSIIVQAAAIYIKKNMPEPPKASEPQEPKE